MPDDSPQFNVARGTVKFEADQSAIDEAFSSIEKRLDALATKIKDTFSIGPLIEQAEQRLAELERRAAAIQLPTIPEPEQPRQPQRIEGQPPPTPFNVDKEMESAVQENTTRETNEILVEIRDLVNAVLNTRDE